MRGRGRLAIDVSPLGDNHYYVVLPGERGEVVQGGRDLRAKLIKYTSRAFQRGVGRGLELTGRATSALGVFAETLPYLCRTRGAYT